MPDTLQYLRDRIVTAVSSTTKEQLIHVRQEMDYRFDVRSITNGAHAEYTKKALNFPLSSDVS
ncbi:hypothetical protein AVEN_148859-1, partial [Araneus ventricosus]